VTEHEEITLIFPPVHDFAMPYLSLPLLKRYIEEQSSVKCNIVDSNQMFFNEIVNIEYLKNELLGCFRNHNLSASVYNAIRLQECVENEIAESLKNSPNYRISLRKLKTPFNTADSESIYKGIQSNNSFNRFFFKNLTDHKFKKTSIFGISICVEDQIFPSFVLAKVIRDLFPKSKIVLGGNIVTRLYENIIKSSLSKYADYLIINEGEDALVELVNFHITKKVINLSNPKIIPIKNNDDGIEKRGVGVNITDIKKIKTPNFSGFNLNSYLSPVPVLPIFISRKCRWAKCDFCSIHTSWDPKHRVRNIGEVVGDIELYISQGINHFRIVDEDCPPNILEIFSDNILQKNLCIFFEAYSRFDERFLDLDFCKKIAKAGCKQLFFGLESFGTQTLKCINKANSYDDYQNIVDKILENTNKVGIINYVFVMVGIPNTPVKDELETVSYIIKNKNIHVSPITSFVVDRNSPIHVDEKVRKKYNINLFCVGDMTTEIGYEINGNDPRQLIQKHSGKLIQEINKFRPDLALTYLINDEIRFILACEFGNNFAQEFISLCTTTQIETILNGAIIKCYEERITKCL